MSVDRMYVYIVGPYDELAYVPGQFETPGGNNHLRITNIYVSSEASIYNGRVFLFYIFFRILKFDQGRRIWNIPKHLATFSFTQLPPQKNRSEPKRVHIKVSQPHIDGSKPNPPFFSAICTLNPYRYIPSFPLNTDYIPFVNFTSTQPPLPGLQESYSEISTNQWRTYNLTTKGRASIISVKPANDSEDGGESLERGEFADGVHFPKVKPVSGVYLEGMVLTVSEPIDEVTKRQKR